MGSFVIKQIEYVGKQYYYKSPEFNTGINVIEGKNGTGKTTLVDLICFALGIYVKEFDPKGTEIHKEICNDKENYVIMKVLINGSLYIFKRFFNNNNIFIQESDKIIELPVNRSDNKVITFSDWLMNQLGIAVVEVNQGTRKSRINFSDIFRLIHYDQDTMPNKIYKTYRNENNFIADSLLIRKIIFELLMGNSFSEYYSLIGQLINTEREKDTKKSILDNYINVIKEMGFSNEVLGGENLVEKLNSIKLQLTKAELYREDLKNNEYTSADFKNHAESLQKDLITIQMELGELSTKKMDLLKEHKNISNLKDDIILETTQLRKIILAHDELNLFSPDTCPYCLQHVERKEDHCICGSPIKENEYERFFYSSEEYLDILHSKQKSIDTIECALESCIQELDGIGTKILDLEIKRDRLKIKLLSLDSVVCSRNTEFNELDDRVLKLNKNIQIIEQQIQMQQKYQEFNGAYEESKENVRILNEKLNEKEIQIKKVMTNKINLFNKIYNELMTSSSKVQNAKIDDDYMPVINDGEYREASSAVPKRFMYYLTLLNMSLLDKDMLFPKFLLIDTPENLGIDHENLEECILKIIEDKPDKQNNFQVILTTGIGKYPQVLKETVIETLSKEKKLLIKRNTNIKGHNENNAS